MKSTFIGMVRKDVTDQTKTHKDKSGLKRSLARLSILITAKEEELDTLKEAWDHLTDLLGTPKYSENVPKPEGEGH